MEESLPTISSMCNDPSEEVVLEYCIAYCKARTKALALQAMATPVVTPQLPPHDQKHAEDRSGEVTAHVKTLLVGLPRRFAPPATESTVFRKSTASTSTRTGRF